MKLNLTINRMLSLLVLLGVIAVVIISVAVVESVHQLNDSQKQLTQIVIPLSEATGHLKRSISGLIIRQERMKNADSIETLKGYAQRKALEADFEQSRLMFDRLTDKNENLTKNLQGLNETYTRFLAADDAVLEAVRHRLELERSMKNQIAELDSLGSMLHRNAEKISEKIAYSNMLKKIRIRRLLKVDNVVDLSAAISEYLDGDSVRAQRASNNLIQGIFILLNYGRQMLTAEDQQRIDNLLKDKINPNLEYIETSLDTLKKLITDSDQLGRYVDNIGTNYQLLKSFLVTSQDSVLILRSDWIKIQKKVAGLNAETHQNALSLLNAINNLDEIGKEIKTSAEDNASKTKADTIWFVIMVSVATVILSAIAAIIIVQAIKRPLNIVVTGLSRMSGKVAEISEQVASSSHQLAERSARQAASIEENTSFLEEVASMTRNTADNSQQAKDYMNEIVRRIQKANQSMENLQSSIHNIDESGAKTFKIIKTIDEIAFQTNLLALNAAVEAARAGEAGAGFSVVASEVRNLAMRSASAAKNTTQLIEGTMKSVQNGIALVGDTHNAFAELTEAVEKIKDLVIDISQIAQEQASGVQEANQVASEMDVMVQETAANAEESASSSEVMSQYAEQMRTYVSNLITLTGASKLNGTIKKRPKLIDKNAEYQPKLIDSKKAMHQKVK